MSCSPVRYSIFRARPLFVTPYLLAICRFFFFFLLKPSNFSTLLFRLHTHTHAHTHHSYPFTKYYTAAPNFTAKVCGSNIKDTNLSHLQNS